MADIVELRDSDPRLADLQTELYEVISKDKYDHVTMAAIIGVLEFLKWNLIHASGR